MKTFRPYLFFVILISGCIIGNLKSDIAIKDIKNICLGKDTYNTNCILIEDNMILCKFLLKGNKPSFRIIDTDGKWITDSIAIDDVISNRPIVNDFKLYYVIGGKSIEYYDLKSNKRVQVYKTEPPNTIIQLEIQNNLIYFFEKDIKSNINNLVIIRLLDYKLANKINIKETFTNMKILNQNLLLFFKNDEGAISIYDLNEKRIVKQINFINNKEYATSAKLILNTDDFVVTTFYQNEPGPGFAKLYYIDSKFQINSICDIYAKDHMESSDISLNDEYAIFEGLIKDHFNYYIKSLKGSSKSIIDLSYLIKEYNKIDNNIKLRFTDVSDDGKIVLLSDDNIWTTGNVYLVYLTISSK